MFCHCNCLYNENFSHIMIYIKILSNKFTETSGNRLVSFHQETNIPEAVISRLTDVGRALFLHVGVPHFIVAQA